MRDGDWEAAWRISDRIRAARRGRLPLDSAGCWLPRHLQWIWDGSSWAGKRLLIRCYHGLGDTIQFIRFVRNLKNGANRISVWAQAQLLPLLSTVDGIDALVELGEGSYPEDYDVDIEVTELAYALRITPADLPGAIPYLQVNDRSLQRRLDARPRVGLVWQSGSWDPRRSVPVALMEQLAEMPGISFQILQRGPGQSAWRANTVEVPRIADIVDEAAALQALDLLICVDTLSAHLAGALGVRTWTLLPAESDWRWMAGREDTPWYPTMRLFRQSRPGEWDSLLATLATELHREFVTSRHAAEVVHP